MSNILNGNQYFSRISANTASAFQGDGGAPYKPYPDQLPSSFETIAQFTNGAAVPLTASPLQLAQVPAVVGTDLLTVSLSIIGSTTASFTTIASNIFVGWHEYNGSTLVAGNSTAAVAAVLQADVDTGVVVVGTAVCPAPVTSTNIMCLVLYFSAATTFSKDVQLLIKTNSVSP